MAGGRLTGTRATSDVADVSGRSSVKWRHSSQEPTRQKVMRQVVKGWQNVDFFYGNLW